MPKRGSEVDHEDEKFEFSVRLVFETTVQAADEDEAIELAQMQVRDRELEVEDVALVG